MDLKEARRGIDSIDREMVRLFRERLEFCREIAEYKREKHLPLTDPVREREKLCKVAELAGKEAERYTAELYSLIFELSKAYEAELSGCRGDTGKMIAEAMERTPAEFPFRAKTACQGVEGAYSQIACERLFSVPEIHYFRMFEDVFSAIEKGECRYGILPVENSTAGSVNKVYDLMRQHRFFIVRSVRLKVEHCLVAARGAKKEDIREIVSHEQAIGQCLGFIRSLGDVRVTVCGNTAAAAKMVRESGRKDLAALCSSRCASLYGLECLEESVQDQNNNYTRFICISKELEIYPGADRTSIMAVTAHRPGALHKCLSRFYACGVNVMKLESRPLPDREFEFMFYFDLGKSVYAPDYVRLIDEMEDLCERYEYLGSYSEVI